MALRKTRKACDLPCESRKMPFKAQHRLCLLTNREAEPKSEQVSSSGSIQGLICSSQHKKPGHWTPRPARSQPSPALLSDSSKTKCIFGSAVLSMQASLTFMFPESAAFCGNHGRTRFRKNNEKHTTLWRQPEALIRLWSPHLPSPESQVYIYTHTDTQQLRLP